MGKTVIDNANVSFRDARVWGFLGLGQGLRFRVQCRVV